MCLRAVSKQPGNMKPSPFHGLAMHKGNRVMAQEGTQDIFLQRTAHQGEVSGRLWTKLICTKMVPALSDKHLSLDIHHLLIT